MKKRTTGPLTAKSALLICGLGLAVGVAFQLFGWLYIPGIGLVISIAVAIGALAFAAFTFGKLGRVTAALLAGTALIGGWIAIRSADFLVAIDILAVITLLTLALWSVAYDRPFWRMGGSDSAFALFDTMLDAIAGAPTPLKALVERREDAGSSRVAPYVRGAAIAVPLLVVLGALLASADAVFSDLLDDIIPSLDVGETFADVLWAIAFSWVAVGLIVLAVQPKKRDESVVREPATWAVKRKERPEKDHYIEAMVVLGAVSLLFLVFVVVQFAYLFGGAAQVEIPGMTYAEYAREGFFQLVAVAALTVAVISISMRIVGDVAEPRMRNAFKAVCWLMVALTFVILASALKRIGLYEDAYGLTRARFFGHAFALWLGAVLVLVAIQVQRRQKGLIVGGSVVLAVIALFAFNAVNPDARIAAHNLDRPRADFVYITELSEDAMPVVFDGVDIDKLSDGDEELLRWWVCGSFASDRDWREWSRGYGRGESSAEAALPVTEQDCESLSNYD